MFLWQIVPSWQQIEDRIRQEMGYQSGAQYRNHWGELASSLSLNIRRVASVRSAFIRLNGKRVTYFAGALPTSIFPSSSET